MYDFFSFLEFAFWALHEAGLQRRERGRDGGDMDGEEQLDSSSLKHFFHITNSAGYT